MGTYWHDTSFHNFVLEWTKHSARLISNASTMNRFPSDLGSGELDLKLIVAELPDSQLAMV